MDSELTPTIELSTSWRRNRTNRANYSCFNEKKRIRRIRSGRQHQKSRSRRYESRLVTLRQKREDCRDALSSSCDIPGLQRDYISFFRSISFVLSEIESVDGLKTSIFDWLHDFNNTEQHSVIFVCFPSVQAAFINRFSEIFDWLSRRINVLSVTPEKIGANLSSSISDDNNGINPTETSNSMLSRYGVSSSCFHRWITVIFRRVVTAYIEQRDYIIAIGHSSLDSAFFRAYPEFVGTRKIMFTHLYEYIGYCARVGLSTAQPFSFEHPATAVVQLYSSVVLSPILMTKKMCGIVKGHPRVYEMCNFSWFREIRGRDVRIGASKSQILTSGSFPHFPLDDGFSSKA